MVSLFKRKSELLLKKHFLSKWEQKVNIMTVVTKMIDNLQIQNDRKLIYGFLPKLKFTGDYKKIVGKLQFKSAHFLKQKALESLIHFVVIKKMQNAVVEKLNNQRL